MRDLFSKKLASTAGLLCAGTGVAGAMTGSLPLLAAAAGLGAAATAANWGSREEYSEEPAKKVVPSVSDEQHDHC